MQKKPITISFIKCILTPLILIPLFLGSCKQEKSMADLILVNGKVVTVDEKFSTAEAVAMHGDTISAVGSNKEIKKLANDNTKVIDVKGKTIIPGLIDTHAHPERASLSELNEELPDAHSVTELLDWIESQAEKKNDGEWILHPKMFFTRLTDMRQPTLEELDKAAPNNPVFLNGSFGGLINSAAMEASGFLGKEKSEELNYDPTSGELTAFIRAAAFNKLALPVEKKLSYEVEVEALKEMFRLYNKYGLTSVLSGYGDLNNYNRYKELSQNGELTVRITQNFLLPYNKTASQQELIDSLKTFPLVTGEGDEWVRTGLLKIFLDGGILTGTAYMAEPWGPTAQEVYDIKDPEYRGVVNYSREQLVNIVSAACATDWTFTAHSTGGGGVNLLLDVFEEVNESYPLTDNRISIIHGNFFTKEAMKKMKKLGIIGHVQAAWFYKDADAMNYILGKDRIKTFNPYRSMIEEGVKLSGGSDHMVKLDANSSINPYNPFLGMWSMITRKTEGGSIICPEEAISRRQALEMYTINGAYATFEEDLKGSLEPGKLADLVVLSDDILTCEEDDIKDIESNLTVVGGKIVYTSN